MEGRDFVTPDDVKTLAAPVLEHRLILDSGARFSGVSVSAILDDVLERLQGAPELEASPMKNKLVFSRSSLLVSIPVIATSALLCVLAAFFGQSALASVLMFLFLLAAVSRIWLSPPHERCPSR